MNRHSNKIRLAFNKSALSYNKNAVMQMKSCSNCLNLLPAQSHFNTIADLGCGTGLSSSALIKKTSFATCYAIDIADELIAQAKQREQDSRIQWITSHFDEVTEFNSNVDLLFSNMALQWSPDLPTSFQIFHHYLRSNGLLLFSMPIEDTFKEIKAPHKNQFLTEHHVLQSLKDSGFQIQLSYTDCQTYEFSSGLQALRSIKAVGANYLVRERSYHDSVQNHGKQTGFFYNPSNRYLSYRIIHVLAMRVSI